MIEKIIYDYLSEALSGVSVCLERPDKDVPSTFVLIERTSGGRVNLLNNCMLAIQSYAPSLVEAAQLNEQVKSKMYDAITLTNVFSVKLNSDYNFTNNTFKGYRYQAVFFITYKE